MFRFVNWFFLIVVSPKYAWTLIKLNLYGNSNVTKKLELLLLNFKDSLELLGIKIEAKNFTLIPIHTKESLSQIYKTIKNKKINHNRAKIDSTSGSTGNTFYFFTDKKYLPRRHGYADYGDSFSKWKFGERRLIFWGAERDVKNSFIKRVVNSRFLFNTEIISSYYMSNQDMSEYVGKINKFKPSLLIGYPSTLEHFSNYIKNSKIYIHAPKSIITSGETLYKEQRVNIEKVFRCKVFNRYGCREVGIIASECEAHDGLHIHSSHVIIEIVDHEGNPCEEGELGEILLTDLDNHIFPFIRYKVGDLGVLINQKCTCGRSSPRLKTVIGRSFDLIIGSNGNHVPGNFFTLIRNKVKGIISFQIVQKSLNELKVSLVVDQNYNKSEEKILVHELMKKLGKDTKLSIELLSEIPVTKTGKHRFVISELKSKTNSFYE